MSVRSAEDFNQAPKSVNIYDYTTTTIAINAATTAITGSIILPTGTYILFASVTIAASTPLLDRCQATLVAGVLTIQTTFFKFNSTLTEPVLDDVKFPLSGVYISNGSTSITINITTDGDAGNVICDAVLRYYRLD